MPVWKKSGNTVLSTPMFLKDSIDKNIPHVLIDLRPATDATSGFIQGAVTVPAAEIGGARDRFPSDKKAPVVLYAGDTKSAIDAFKVLRAWGYSNTTILEGGIEAWKKAGYPVISGTPGTDIVYVPKPRPGEISVDDFKRIAETLPADTLILDTRDEDEAMQGMLKGAQNIPAQDLPSRLTGVPKEKEIITHCTTGVRAEMAYHILKEAGYRARFLNAAIRIDKDGKYEISKE